MKNKKSSLSGKLRGLSIRGVLPSVILIVVVLAMFIFYSFGASQVSHRIADASKFNQDFKETVDLKMYYYVTDSEYATGTPDEEVEDALTLAGNLRDVTTNKDSLKAINNVISLCENLKKRIDEIRNSSVYVDKMQQLETNIYVITELIQNYMYTYLYYEAGELAAMQQDMDIMLIGIILAVVVTTAFVMYMTMRQSRKITHSILDPIDQIYDRVKNVGEGELKPMKPVTAEDEKLQTLSEGFEEMVERLVKQMELNKQEAEQIKKMELQLLQAQINPHFLYNTLETIVWLIEIGKNEQAIEMVSSLSNFFRSSLSKGRDVISLGEEEIHARSYLEIQQVRYKDILTYKIDIAPEIKGYNMPKLTLQPLIENALYHGIKLKRGGGTITVLGYTEGEKVILSVEDTGIGMNEDTRNELLKNIKSDNTKGFGMSAVYKRLRLMYGEDCDMYVDSSEGQGTIARIEITRPVMEKMQVLENEIFN